MYTEDGQLQNTFRFRPSNGKNTYRRAFYNKVSKNVVGYVWDTDNDRMWIEQLSGETGELQHSYSLYNINFPTKSHFHVVGHPSGTLALVSDFHIIVLKKPSQ